MKLFQVRLKCRFALMNIPHIFDFKKAY